MGEMSRSVDPQDKAATPLTKRKEVLKPTAGNGVKINHNNDSKSVPHDVSERNNDSDGGSNNNNGNNSEDSAGGLISVGNDSFGFNFDSEENSESEDRKKKGSREKGKDRDGELSSGYNKSDGIAIPDPIPSTSLQNAKTSKNSVSVSSVTTSSSNDCASGSPSNSAVAVAPAHAKTSSSSGAVPLSSPPSVSSIDASITNAKSTCVIPANSTISSTTTDSTHRLPKRMKSHDEAAASASARLRGVALAVMGSKEKSDFTVRGREERKEKDGTITSGYKTDNEGIWAGGSIGARSGEEAPLNHDHDTSIDVSVPERVLSLSKTPALTDSSSSSPMNKVQTPTQPFTANTVFSSLCPDEAPKSYSPSSSPLPSEITSTAKGGKKRKHLAEDKREERNAREKERSFRISKQINELRNLLSSGGVIVPKGTKSSVLTEAANYIRMLQQHQYRSEIDRHQLIQQIQVIGNGALGPEASTAIRHVAAQNGVWSLGNFGGLPPRSAMTPQEQKQAETDPPKSEPEASNVVNKIEEHEYRFIFNSCSVGMAIASMGGAFIDCNGLFCQLSQYTKQEVCSLTIFNLTSRADLQHAFDLISQMIAPPTEDTVESAKSPLRCVLRGSMKSRNDLGLSITLIKDGDGIAKCFCVSLIHNPVSPFDNTRPFPATVNNLLPKNQGAVEKSSSLPQSQLQGQTQSQVQPQVQTQLQPQQRQALVQQQAQPQVHQPSSQPQAETQSQVHSHSQSQVNIQSQSQSQSDSHSHRHPLQANSQAQSQVQVLSQIQHQSQNQFNSHSVGPGLQTIPVNSQTTQSTAIPMTSQTVQLAAAQAPLMVAHQGDISTRNSGDNLKISMSNPGKMLSPAFMTG